MGEIYLRSFHAGDLPGGDAFGIQGSVFVRVDGHGVIVHRTLPAEVEIRVVGGVENGGLIGAGTVVDTEPVPDDGIPHLDRQVAGIALLPVGGFQGKGDRVIVQFGDPPYPLV